LFISYMKDREYSKDTQNGYLHDLKHFLLSLNNKAVGDVTDIDVMYYLTQVRESGAGARYRNRCQSAIRLFYKVMVRFRVTDHNPAMDIEKAKVEKKRQPTYLQKQFLDASLELIKGRHLIRDASWNTKDPAFFVSQFRRRISKRMVQTIAEKTFNALIEQHPQLAGLPLSAHKLRHSFATFLLR
jgi:site-specific recombinase XerD